jgi:integrase
MASVFIQKRKSPKTGKISYQVQYKDPNTNKTCYYKTFPRSMDAQKASQDLRAQIDNGKVHELHRKKRKFNPLKFSEVADQTVAVWKERVGNGQLRKTTFEGYALRVAVLKRTFGERLLLDLTTKHLDDFHKKLFREQSPASANRYLFILKQIFAEGIRSGAIKEDPTVGIKYLSEKQHERNRFLMPESIEQLVAASQKTKAKFYMPALIYLGAEHGASRQEALSLQWSDINFDYEGVGLIRFFRTKNGNERTEFLMPRTRQALLDWQAHQEWMRHRKKVDVKDDRYVFCRLDGEPFKRIDSAWRRICKLAGIQNFHYHDLRHTFCSNLVMSGHDLKVVKDMIGHSDIAMTDRYSHLSALHKRAVQTQLAEHYSQEG